jgi:Xaa-Pro aminopeptidase
LFWQCGIDQEQSVLVLFPDCPKGEKFKEVLFLRQTNDHIKVWEGYKLTKEQATEISGVQTVKWLEEMPALLNEMILLAENIYLNSNENDRFESEVPSRDQRFAAELRSKYHSHNYMRAQPIMKKLRMIKSAEEVDVIKKACGITEKAFRRVLQTTKPGMLEYEVEAEIIHEFIRNGANGHAYDPIIASGGNACILHYNDNNHPLEDGDVMLLDFGCEYGNYASDLTRSIPVNGRFTQRQKDVYNAVLRVMKFATGMLRPGTTLEAYSKEVGKMMTSELVGLKLLDPDMVAKESPNADWPMYKMYFPHGTSHHLGLDVHDLMERYATFQPGMVFTCEPGIYIPQENLGIRLENDILVTDGNPIDLMASIPLEADEIEDLMNSK